MSATTRIDRVLQDAAGKVPGLVALATTGTETIYEGAFGRRDVSAEAPMTVDTVFWLASMTKAVVSAAAMQLVEQNRLALDTPIAQTLPALAAPKVLAGFDAAGAPVLRDAAGPITLRQLLSHSAGYGYTMWNAELGRYLRHADLPRVPTNWEELQRTPLLFDPGTRWNYGINTDLVGKVVEAASGQLLDEYLRDHVLGPLGMHDTGVTLSSAQRARQARMHARQEGGSLTPMEFPVGQGPSFFMGGGALCGTGRDYLRFLRMMLNGGTLDGTRLLSPRTVAEMARNQIGDISVVPMRSATPATTNDADFFPGMEKKWGLGFLINTQQAPTGRSAGSLAWAGLGNTYYWIDPTAGVAGVILMQMLPFADEQALDVFAGFERAVYAAIGG
ncbi:serine hydrolase domain-containing protein [Limobrevibacterium gyesilva]|uniref:Beta-lactamase family protein n=1 Tax=Limobrevibacterium gyesilva TaxID=2991712 RepID=A0AA42CE92_9PROT|nr:serine hydrolase domain-containing protein [Limobrevibacterium gyesilva]MCW3475773.1 beta-lactamase family protein [Limobrevibacterium gyesilva]